jgi:MFS family permease
VLSTFAMQFVTVAVGWELYERTGDPWALAMVGLVQIVPVMVLLIPAGNAADRFRRRDIGLIASGLQAIVAIGLSIVSWLQAPVELVFGLLLLAGIARAFGQPAMNALLPQIIEPKYFANANAWLISTFQLSSIIGPAVAGGLIALSGTAFSSYVTAAIGQLAFVALLTTLPSPPVAPRQATGRSLGDFFAGIAFIRRTPVFLAAITMDMFAVLLGGAVALLPIYAKDILDAGPIGLGLLRAAPGLGAIATAQLTTRVPPWKRPGRVLMWMVAGFGVFTIGFGLSTNMILSLVCLFMVGAFDSVSMVIRQTLQQMVTPDHLRGRVAAVYGLFVGISNELGAFESGAVAALFGPVVSVVGGGIGTLVVVGIVAAKFPVLWNVGPLHTLRPMEPSPTSVVPQPAR